MTIPRNIADYKELSLTHKKRQEGFEMAKTYLGFGFVFLFALVGHYFA